MDQPCPKKGISSFSTRYKSYMCAAVMHDLSQQAVETVNGDQERNSMMCQVLIDVDEDLATKKEHEDIIRMLMISL
jgi:hypothetical protein